MPGEHAAIGGPGHGLRRAEQPGQPAGRADGASAPEEVGADHARGEQRDGNAGSLQLVPQSERCVAQEGLGSSVKRETGARSNTGQRADIEDGAATARNHGGQHGTGQAMRHDHVGSEQNLEILVSALGEGCTEPAPGVVDQVRDLEARRCQGLGDAGHRVGSGHVEGEGEHADAIVALELASSGLQALLQARDQKDAVAVGGKLAGDRQSNSRRAAGYQRDWLRRRGSGRQCHETVGTPDKC